MFSFAAIAFVASIGTFVVLLMLVSYEQRRGQRLVGVSLRHWCDVQVDKVGVWLLTCLNHFVKYVVQLNWYYSIHSVLRMMLRVMVRFYTYFENVFERNRLRTKRLRAEKRTIGALNHLHKMAEHKEDTALTPKQKQKLRHKKLEEKH